jgi:hypothetical protein
VNQELHDLFDEDQADRRGELPADLRRRDQRRRRRVERALAQGAVTDPDDLFRAAMVFQHGSDRAHDRRAHELARRAAELGSARPARWLAAAAHDRERGLRITVTSDLIAFGDPVVLVMRRPRSLMAGGLPQKYGTQYRSVDGRWVLCQVDPTTSDEERARWDVPPLAEALRRAAQMTHDDRRDRRQGGDP